MNNSSAKSTNTVAAILVLCGIISGIITTISDSEFFSTGGALYVVVDILYIINCAVAAFGLFKEDLKIIRIGAFIAAGGYAFKAAVILFRWIINNIRYNYGVYDGMIWQIAYLVMACVGAVGFGLLGLYLDNRKIAQLKANSTAIIAMIAISVGFELLYPFRYFTDYTYDLGEFFGPYFKGEFTMIPYLFLTIGFIVYIMTARQQAGGYVQNTAPAIGFVAQPAPGQAINPQAQAVNPQAQAINPQAQAINPQVQAVNPQVQAVNPQVQASKAQPVTGDPKRFELIRKYKTLLDEGIISQEEFEAKKKEFLGL